MLKHLIGSFSLIAALIYSSATTAATVKFDFSYRNALGRISGFFEGVDVDGDGWITNDAVSTDIVTRAGINATIFDGGIDCYGGYYGCTVYDLYGALGLDDAAGGIKAKTDLTDIVMYFTDGPNTIAFSKKQNTVSANAELVYEPRYLLTSSITITATDTGSGPPAVPVPETGILLLSALGGVVLMRRRRSCRRITGSVAQIG